MLIGTLLASVLAAASPATTAGVRADIDGDGSPDNVSLIRRPHDFVLRVQARGRVITRAVRGFSGTKASGLGLPRIVALRPLNRRRGLEIEVRVWRGASHDFLVFFTMHRGRLVTMTGGPRSSSWPPYVWDVGGSLIGYETADCIAPHTIGLTGVYPQAPRRWVSTAAQYDVRETRFVRIASYRRVSKELPRSVPKGWPRLKNRDFKSCGGIALDPRAR